jgi:L-fuconolactonase
MARRVDAHMHLFRPGFVAELPEDCRRVQPDEVTLYQALAKRHGVDQALVVGYEGAPWAAGNNRYVAALAAQHAWIRPLAYVNDLRALDVATLHGWLGAGFVGLSMYLFDEPVLSSLSHVPADVWTWLVRQQWLISVNSQGEHWLAWNATLERHPELTVLVSHLGLPRAVATAPSAEIARAELGTVCSLARFPNVYVKLSGFYALAEPAYDYPHQATWPYVEVVNDAFGTGRLLWGSDFAPSLEWLSFPQTLGVLAEMSFFTEADRECIEGENLSALLDRLPR